MKKRKSIDRKSLRCVVAVLFLATVGAPAAAQEETSALNKATGYYWDGLFEKAVGELEGLSRTLTGEERIVAYEYLARSHVRLGNESKGKEVFKELLRLEPEWTPDPTVVAGPEMTVFEAAQEEWANESLGSINIRTEPTRANVFLDGELRKEPTPLTIERVPAGDHAIRVELRGWAAVDTSVTVVASDIAALDLTLEAAPDEGAASAPFWKKRWIQVTGGVLGVGLILALAGGGGGGGGTGEEPAGDLPGFPDPPK